MSGRRLFRTRVGARIFGLFLLGAVVPVLILEVLSYRAVSSLLEEHSEARLAQLADASVQIVLERLSSSLTWVQSAGPLALGAATPDAGLSAEDLAPVLSGMALQGAAGLRPVAGRVEALPSLEPAELARVAEGSPVLKARISDAPEEPSAVYLAIPSPTEPGSVLWAELAADSIWASAMVLGAGPSVSDMCVLDHEWRPFACKSGLDSALPARFREAAPGGSLGLLRLEIGGETHLAAWKRLYLRAGFGVPDWYVVVSESEESVHAPVATFNYNLPLALSVGLGIVLLLANWLVRRTMDPLERLSIGTQRLAGHELSARVSVESDDEFGELAASFNTMAQRLASQFGQIEAAQAIDRAVIEDNNSTRAVEALIAGIESLLDSTRCAVMLDEEAGDDVGGLYRRGGDGRMLRSGLSVDELASIRAACRETSETSAPMDVPRPLLEAGFGADGRGAVFLPMKVQQTRIGVTAIEVARDGADAESMSVARKLVDRAAVALNENRLRRELVEFGGETLRALANAIDAKSRWTTGHSERVTDLAWAIGREMGLGPTELDHLHRGGLLHDIGKIGVSTEILDWPGRLDDAQRVAVQAHTTIGARILDPIRVFKPLLPIVLHHHERWDGHGYPHGLSGRGIPKLARVVAVADVFDALASARPYRQALPMDVVLDHIGSQRERSFDPEVVEAFDRVIAAGWVHLDQEVGAAVRG